MKELKCPECDNDRIIVTKEYHNLEYGNCFRCGRVWLVSLDFMSGIREPDWLERLGDYVEVNAPFNWRIGSRRLRD